MAFLSKKVCLECNKTTNHINHCCMVCEDKKFRTKEELYKKEIKALSLQGRVERLEKIIKNLLDDPPWIEPRY